MGKSSARTLPPLVHGKLAGTFEFTVVNVEITEKVFKNADRNFAVQILWWGETKPLFVRPRRIQFLTEDKKQVIIDGQTGNSVRYEVRTKVNLFKSYLAKCDVMELIILDEVKNEVVGSSFLKDLIFLVYNTQIFTNPIINHSGNPIGKITSQFLFFEVSSNNLPVDKVSSTNTNVKHSPVDNWNSNDLKININLSDLYSSREEVMSRFESNRTSKQNNVPQEILSGHDEKQSYKLDSSKSGSSNIHFNSPETEKVQLLSDGSRLWEANAYINNETTSKQHLAKSNAVDLPQVLPDVDPCSNLKTGQEITVMKYNNCSKKPLAANFTVNPPQSKSSAKDKRVLPNKLKKSNTVKKNVNEDKRLNKAEEHNVRYSPKFASKRVLNNKNKSNIENKNSNSKTVTAEKNLQNASKGKVKCRIGVNAVNTVKVQKTDKISSPVITSIVASNPNVKNFATVSKEISKLNKLYLSPTRESHDDAPNLEKLPLKENKENNNNSNNNVSDSIESEDHSVREKNKVKVVGDVETVCQEPKLVHSDEHHGKGEESPEQGKNIEYPTTEKVNIDNKLFFDLNDPVEKIYYETFYLNTKTLGSNEFEIAELLNQPENKYILEVAPQERTVNDDVTHRRSRYSNVSKSEPSNCSMSHNVNAKTVSLRKGTDTNDILAMSEKLNPFSVAKENSSEPGDEEVCMDEKLKFRKEYNVNCHHCKYYKKLNELDKIIEALKNFEVKLKKDLKQSKPTSKEDNFCYGSDPNDQEGLSHRHYSTEHFVSENNDPEGDNTSQEELVLGNTESDFSKEDSDFLEFTHYLTKR